MSRQTTDPLSRLKERLEEVTVRYELILESAGEGILGLDANGVQTFVNPAAAHLLGYAPAELVGRPSHPLWHHTRRDGTPHPSEECPIYKAFHDGAVHRMSGDVFWRKDGTSFLVEYVSTPMREHGALAGAVVVFRDISKEARLESIAEAVETMNSIGYVFSAVRHELGNPVNSLKMALSVLRKNLDRFPRATVVDYLDRLLAEVARMQDLLVSLRSFSLYEHVRPVPIAIGSFLQQFRALTRPDLEARGIAFDEGAAPGDGHVHADPRALQQVLLNCVANAVDAVGGVPGPRIRLEGRWLGELFEILLEDNGSGLSEEVRRNLFKPFYTTKPSGTGLGLVIARKMLARMEGAIVVTSVEGAGTRIAITLRREEPL